MYHIYPMLTYFNKVPFLRFSNPCPNFVQAPLILLILFLIRHVANFGQISNFGVAAPFSPFPSYFSIFVIVVVGALFVCGGG